MITRFSMYGFLKNFDFSEPFIILFYLSLGLNYLQIGILIAFLNVCINIMEIPSGAFADLYGRKTSMVVSLTSYLVSFAIFAFTTTYAPLFFALFFYSIGDAFRSGTHKAMIFDWLKINNRLTEKTKVYGFTRSWSNYGSAISVLFATLIVLFSKDYRYVFLLSIIPGALGVWNILCYPEELNRKQVGSISLKKILIHTKDSIKKSFANSNIRLLIIQGLGFEGCFVVSKDYLQPILKAQAIALAAFFMLPEKQSTAIIVGIIYFILHMLSASTSKRAHKFASKFKSEKGAVVFLIFAASVLAFASSLGLFFQLFVLSISAYVLYYLLQNLWMPIQVTQYDDFAESSEQATILSIAAQTKTLGVAILAPVVGFVADNYGIQVSMFIVSILLLVLASLSLVVNRKDSK